MLRNLSRFLLVTLPLLSAASASLSEQPVSIPIYGSAPVEQFDPLVGWNGENFLAVWNDARMSPAETLYAARFTGDGTLLDPTGILIPSHATSNHTIAGVLPMNNGTWVVIWTEPGAAAGSPWRISAARLDRTGRLLGPPRLIAESQYTIAPRRGATTNGRRIIVGYGNRYAILDEAAEPIQSDIEIPGILSDDRSPLLVSNGSGFLVVSTSGSNTDSQLAELDSDGRMIVSRRVPEVRARAVASDGIDYLVGGRNPRTGEWSTRRVNSKAEVIAAQTIPGSEGVASNVDLIWTGHEFWFAFGFVSERAFGLPVNEILGLRLDRSGVPIDSTYFDMTDGSFGNRPVTPSLALGESQLAVVWHGSLTSGKEPHIYANFASVTPVFVHSAPILLSRSANSQIDPHVAFSGRNYLSVWQEPAGIYASRVSTDGQALDGRGISIATGSTPRVVFDETNFIVTWIDSGTLWANRIRPDTGAFIDPARILIATRVCSYDLKSDRGKALVAWTDCDSLVLFAARIESGRPTDYPLAISPFGMRTIRPSIASNGSEYFIAFEEQIIPPGPNFFGFKTNVRGVRISSEMTLFDTEPLEIAVSDIENENAPQAASNGRDFLVGWSDTAMRTRSVAADGTLGAISMLGGGFVSSLIWDGLHYAIAYTANGDAFMAHIGVGDRLIISATGDDEVTPALLAAADRMIATYVRVATEPLYGGVPRVFLREPTPTRTRPAHAR